MGTKNNKQKPSKNTSISITNSAFSTETSQSITNIISINSITTNRDNKSKSSLASEILLINKFNNATGNNQTSDTTTTTTNKTGVIYRFAKEIEDDLEMRKNSGEVNKKKNQQRTRTNSVRFSEDIATFRFERKSKDDLKIALAENSEEQSELQVYRKKSSLFPAAKIFKLIRATK